jgi:hypothetical protein
MDIDYDFPGYQASVSKMLDQDITDNKKEEVKRRIDSIDAEEYARTLWTFLQRKESPQKCGCATGKFPKKKSDSSA